MNGAKGQKRHIGHVQVAVEN